MDPRRRMREAMDVEGRYLLGCTPVAQTARFLRQQAGFEVAEEELAQRAEAAGELRRERGEPDEAEAPLPESWRAHLDRVAARPSFQRLYAERRWRFAALDPDRVFAVQPHVDLSYALQCSGAHADADGLLELCLPAEPEPIDLWGGAHEGDPPGATLFSRDLNVRVTSVQMVRSPQLELRFRIGKTSSFAQVTAVGRRLYLTNGTHRMVGLGIRGVRLVPCVRVEGDSPGDLPDMLPLHTLAGAGAPLVSEFADPRFHIAFPWQPRVKMIRLVPDEFAAPLPSGPAAPDPAPTRPEDPPR